MASFSILAFRYCSAYIFFKRAFFRFQFLHASHQAGIHTSVLGSPFIKHGAAHAMLAAQLWNWRTGFGLLQDGDDLAVGKA